MNGQSYLSVEGLEKRYGNGSSGITILDNLNMECSRGEITIITGESGSGKTTLLNILGGLDSADRGTVTVEDIRVSSLKEQQLFAYRQQKLGFIFQFHHLLRDFSALENTILPALIAGERRHEAESRGRELLDRVGLGERMDNLPHQLSGGERQRVAITRALINNPALILADEPTGSLDEERSREVEDLLFDLVRSREGTMIIVTHDQRLTARGDRSLHLTRGRLQQ
ncbi:ABC transporter ATP-binding protein [Salinispira pacifica]|uniref:Lipoprotein releasing system ATP-binding protein LolD n=1 Tax=Salinispira pacifica TaxID=1307761 RepID=V5WFC7_9SPIO|nr:ABC transporter ATP-binding protein [Salinispira pacifica]AHC14254.1 Lipoprotein releasing system ATP-binding protein LolD [Salinispira pacifica]